MKKIRTEINGIVVVIFQKYLIILTLVF